MKKYSKAIAAFIALLVALAQAHGFEIPDDTVDQIMAIIITLAGTFGVYQVTNKKDKPDA